MRKLRLRWWLPILLIVACGGSSVKTSPTAEYADEIERLVLTMNATLDAVYADAESVAPTLETERARIVESLAARNEFLEDASKLEPPVSFAALHDSSKAIITDLRDANAALAQAAESAETLADLTAAWEGPAGDEFRAADARSIQLCLDVQEYFDTGLQQASQLANPWLNSSRVEPVSINLGCVVPS